MSQDLENTTWPVPTVLPKTRYTSDAFICSSCRDILIRPKEIATEESCLPIDWATVKQSAKSECPICVVFYRYMCSNLDSKNCTLEMMIRFSEHCLINGEYKTVPTNICLISSKANSNFDMWFMLNPAVSYGATGQMQNYTRLQKVQDPPFSVSTPILPKNTGNARCMEQARAWMQECLKTHSHCSASFGTGNRNVYPTRLIYVEQPMTRIVATHEVHNGKRLRYMTLSHKWRRHSMPKLLSSNLKEMQQDFDPDDLPQVFKDAISLAKTLGIPFVWIDALCIIQDNSKDLEFEISNMGHIYRNAVLNVGGLIAASDQLDNMSDTESDAEFDSQFDSEQDVHSDVQSDIEDMEMTDTQAEVSPGLFVERNTQKLSPFAVSVRRSNCDQNCFAYIHGHLYELQFSTLMKRGWVLQERLLSRRSLYFGSQMFWECSERLACEAFPDRVPSLGGLGHGLDCPYRLSTLLARKSVHRKTFGRPLRKNHHQYMNWLSVVGWFTACGLSYDADFLPALSGLAHAFQVYLKDYYYAGLWGKDMIQGLLWYCCDDGSTKVGRFPSEYSAPSWSWASTNFEVGFVDFHQRERSRLKPVCIAKVEEVHTTPSGSDPLSRVLSGHLRIAGHLRKSTRTATKRHTRVFPTHTVDHSAVQYEWYDEGYTGDGIRDIDGAYYFLMAGKKPEYSDDVGKIMGLIIEPIEAETTTYRRIGAFEHVWGDLRTEDDNPKPEDYPEFVDFNPENYERHTITII